MCYVLLAPLARGKSMGSSCGRIGGAGEHGEIRGIEFCWAPRWDVRPEHPPKRIATATNLNSFFPNTHRSQEINQIVGTISKKSYIIQRWC